MPKDTRTKKKQYQNDEILSKPSSKSLGRVLYEDQEIKKYGSVKSKSSSSKNKSYKKERQKQLDNEYMDEKTSKRILELSREQLLEEEEKNNEVSSRMMNSSSSIGNDNKKGFDNNLTRKNRNDNDSSDDEEDDDVIIEEYDDEDLTTTDVIHNNKDGYVTVNESSCYLSEEQEELVSTMMGGKRISERKTLADMILAKIEEKEEQQRQQAMSSEEQHQEEEEEGRLPDKVIEVYTDIGKILSAYTSGKLPKAFKIIPSLSNWEDILYLTRPDQWTPQAMYAATRIFASNLNPKMAQRFFNLVLLDAIRADIHQNDSLNYHYYQSLLKSAYKPAAFFKGIILPLARPDAMCTLREGLIVASALKRLSIPVHHSAVAIIKLATGSYTPSASIFLRELLNKKYSLPASVIQTIVMEHFAKFIHYTRTDQVLPVLWHQSLLVFVQRYKEEIKVHDEYKDVLKTVMKVHYHPKITREIRRELFEGAAWNEERNMIDTNTCSNAVPMDL